MVHLSSLSPQRTRPSPDRPNLTKRRIALRTMAHLSEDETVAKMGHPVFRCGPPSPNVNASQRVRPLMALMWRLLSDDYTEKRLAIDRLRIFSNVVFRSEPTPRE